MVTRMRAAATLLLFGSLTYAACYDPIFGGATTVDRTYPPIAWILSNSTFTDEQKFHEAMVITFSNNDSLFENVYRYNANLRIPCPPDGTTVESKTYIKDAWIREVTVMPSLIEPEIPKHWVLPNGSVQSAYSYHFEVPANASNRGTTCGGSDPDCGTVYTVLSKSEDIPIYANGMHIGNGSMATYNVSNTTRALNTTSILALRIQVKRDIYEPNTYCCEEENDSCIKYQTDCVYARTEIDDENVTLSDSLLRDVYSFSANSSIEMYFCPDDGNDAAAGMVRSNISSPFRKMLVSFNTASVRVDSSRYDFTTALPPVKVIEPVVVNNASLFPQLTYASNYSSNGSSLNFTFSHLYYKEALNGSHALVSFSDLFELGYGPNATNITCPLNGKLAFELPRVVEENKPINVTVHFARNDAPISGKTIHLQYATDNLTAITDPNGSALFTINPNRNYSILRASFEYDGEYSPASEITSITVYSGTLISDSLAYAPPILLLAATGFGLYLMGRGSHEN